MKIKESKYYHPVNVLQVDSDDHIELYDKYKLLTFTNPYRGLLDDLMARIYFGGDDLVIHRDKLKHFIKCTDYYTFEYASKQNELYESEECYFHPTLEVFLLIDKNLSNEYDSQIFEDGLYKVSSVYYENTNPKTKENLNKLFEDYIEKYVSKESKVSILLKTSRGIDIKTHTIKPYRIDFETMYNDDFAEVHHHVKNALTNEDKGVVLVLEDCENYIAESTSFNSNTDVVSSILNIADGMLSDVLECQLICTFNSDISKIDAALLRKGRLIAEYKFKELTVEKCNKYLQSTDRNLVVERPYSLAELTNIDSKELKADNKQSKIGFK